MTTTQQLSHNDGNGKRKQQWAMNTTMAITWFPIFLQSAEGSPAVSNAQTALQKIDSFTRHKKEQGKRFFTWPTGRMKELQPKENQ